MTGVSAYQAVLELFDSLPVSKVMRIKARRAGAHRYLLQQLGHLVLTVM
jgi:hypothetical protein